MGDVGGASSDPDRVLPSLLEVVQKHARQRPGHLYARAHDRAHRPKLNLAVLAGHTCDPAANRVHQEFALPKERRSSAARWVFRPSPTATTGPVLHLKLVRRCSSLLSSW